MVRNYKNNATLRYRILREGIRCVPWRYWRGEIRELPISSQTLFRRGGTSIDCLEISLRSEGYLLENEKQLLETLKNPENLKRRPYVDNSQFEEELQWDFPDDWEQEDFEDYYKSKLL